MPDMTPTSASSKRPSRTLELMRTEASALRRWMRNASSRENVVAGLKTLAWVVPLTVLIWVYAEREQIYKTPNPITIPIEVASGDPTRIVTLIRPQEKMVMADLEGARSRVDYVTSVFTRNEKPASIKVVVDPKFTPGQPHDITAAPMIQEDALFRDNGVKVTTCQPPILTVFVDTVEELDVPVETPPSVTNLVAGKTTLQPARVHVRAPSKALEKVRSNGPLVAHADLANLDELRTPGDHDIAAVRVYIPGIEPENVTISPPTIKASLEVRAADITFTIRTMPINVSGPAFLLKQYRVEIKDNRDSIANIKVVGPVNQIEMISKENVKPTAVLEIKAEDRPFGATAASDMKSRTLRYELPEGVRVAPDDAQRTVDFKLVERTTDQ